jgi:carbon storage regulator
MLILSRKPGDSLMINDDVEIKVIEVNGDKVKIGVAAPKEVKILRKELSLTVESNKDSVMPTTPAALRTMLRNGGFDTDKK